MEYNLVVAKIYEDADFNPACFQYSEAEAREKKFWRDARPMPTQAELDAAEILVNKESQIKPMYDQMVTDIYDEMLRVFGTSNDVSVSATAATLEAMLKRPANYVSTDLGLVDEAAVTTYATAKLGEADAYGIFRLKRIAQYQTEKAAILNP